MEEHTVYMLDLLEIQTALANDELRRRICHFRRQSYRKPSCEGP